MSPRGTSNSNERGSAEQRRKRKEWLIETYRADVDGMYVIDQMGYVQPYVLQLGRVHGGQPACRCYRCGVLLVFENVTVDRIIPGCQGGTYRRNNIRPACGRCNSITGTELRERLRRAA